MILMKSVEEKLKSYDLTDNSILSHGFTIYKCDYEIVTELLSAANPGVYVYLFRSCVEAHYESYIAERGAPSRITCGGMSTEADCGWS